MKIKQILFATAFVTASCNLYADSQAEHEKNVQHIVSYIKSCQEPVARLYLEINKTKDHVDKVHLKKYANTIEDKLRHQYPDYKTLTVSHLILSPEELISRPTLITTFYTCYGMYNLLDNEYIETKDIVDFLEQNIYPAYRKDGKVNYAALFE